MRFPVHSGKWIETGYPLSVPLVIGPWSLGPTNAELEFLETMASKQPSGFEAELLSLAWIFGNPIRIGPQLTSVALGALGLAIAGAVVGFRGSGAGSMQRRYAMVLLLASTLALLTTYFAPSFESVRLNWGETNARHLLPAILPLLPLAFMNTGGQTWRG